MPITWVPISKSGLRLEWLDSRNVPVARDPQDIRIKFAPSWAELLYKAECGGGAVGGVALFDLPESDPWKVELSLPRYRSHYSNKRIPMKPGTAKIGVRGLSKEHVNTIARKLRYLTDPDASLRAAMAVNALAGPDAMVAFLDGQQ